MSIFPVGLTFSLLHPHSPRDGGSSSPVSSRLPNLHDSPIVPSPSLPLLRRGPLSPHSSPCCVQSPAHHGIAFLLRNLGLASAWSPTFKAHSLPPCLSACLGSHCSTASLCSSAAGSPLAFRVGHMLSWPQPLLTFFTPTMTPLTLKTQSIGKGPAQIPVSPWCFS